MQVSNRRKNTTEFLTTRSTMGSKIHSAGLFTHTFYDTNAAKSMQNPFQVKILGTPPSFDAIFAIWNNLSASLDVIAIQNSFLKELIDSYGITSWSPLSRWVKMGLNGLEDELNVYAYGHLNAHRIFGYMYHPTACKDYRSEYWEFSNRNSNTVDPRYLDFGYLE